MTKKRNAHTTVTGQLEAAQAPDRSADVAPRDIAGVALLTEAGLATYDQLYRSREGWPVADLILISQAALALQIIADLQGVLAMTGPTGADGRPNPAIAAIGAKQKVVATLLRDAGIRARDGTANDLRVPRPTTHQPNVAAKPVTGPDFGEWLN